MSIKTIFSSTISSEDKIDNVYKILKNWLKFQEIDGLKQYGYYLLYLPNERIPTFNFFIVNQSGVTADQREKIWAILELQNFCILREVVKHNRAK